MEKEILAQKLSTWYQTHKRQLPWRGTTDPYKIWISEIILQQTRIDQGLPYYKKFLERFPTLQHLADATETEVLSLWQGLGYYTRARNMLYCAKILQYDFEGHFPENYDELCRLKGIGEYTAAAIASFAFGKKVAVLDGNVFRVLSRVFGLDDDIMSAAGKKMFSKLANELLPDKDSDISNQAIMEFGALQCVPKNPDCNACPLKELCFAFRNSNPHAFPVKRKKKMVRTRFFSYFAIMDELGYYMRLRQPGDIWTGLYDFYMLESNGMKGFDEAAGIVKSKYGAELKLNHQSNVFKHQLTHQTIYAIFFRVSLGNGSAARLIAENRLTSFSEKEIISLPKPVLISKFLCE
jgi:A/G-specific adenine glycosylase